MKTGPLRLNTQSLRPPANRVTRPEAELASRPVTASPLFVRFTNPLAFGKSAGDPVYSSLSENPTNFASRANWCEIHQMGNLLGKDMHREFTQSDKTHAKQIYFLYQGGTFVSSGLPTDLIRTGGLGIEFGDISHLWLNLVLMTAAHPFWCKKSSTFLFERSFRSGNRSISEGKDTQN